MSTTQSNGIHWAACVVLAVSHAASESSATLEPELHLRMPGMRLGLELLQRGLEVLEVTGIGREGST
jgi:hypothetical protein